MEEDFLKWLEENWTAKPMGEIVFHTGKAGAILQYMHIYREFCNPTKAEELAYREKLEAELREGIYTIGGENFIEHTR